MSAEWDDLARLAEAATPGPWHLTQIGSAYHLDAPSRDEVAAIPVDAAGGRDAEFIAAANPATILRLIKELRVVDHASTANAHAHMYAERRAKALAARLAAVEALLADGPDTWRPYQVREAGGVFMADEVTEFTADLRAALSAAPTDTTKEN